MGRHSSLAGLVYVTGISGAGKSAVCADLRRRGYEAHDADEDGNAVWVHGATGAITRRATRADRTPEFMAENEWRLDLERVRMLAERAEQTLVFLCGSVANDRVVWPLFRRTVYLAIDDATLLERLRNRRSNDFGKSDHERAMVLEWHRVDEEAYRSYGSVIVDATRPIDLVVDDVIAAAHSPNPGAAPR